MLSAELIAQDRQGALILVKKVDGQRIEGELIAVEQKSLLILDRKVNERATVELDDINFIKIIGKDNAMKMGGSIGIGALLGSLIGASIGIAGTTTELGAIFFGAIGGAIGIVVGLILGITVGVGLSTGEKYQIEGKPEAYKNRILNILRKMDRVHDHK